jgi:winged helix DNA-binding protein
MTVVHALAGIGMAVIYNAARDAELIAKATEMVIKLLRDQVNSFRLAKQHLLNRAPKTELVKVVSDVCGVQAQVMSGAGMAIWARVDNVTVGDIEDALWKRRRLVKTWCMRGTLHLLSADDLPVYVAALKTRRLYRSGSWLKFHKISLKEIDSITSEARNALDGRCLTRQELVNDIVKRAGLRKWVRREMASGWGSLLHPASYQGNLCFGPRQGRNVTFVRPDQWLRTWKEPSSERAFRTLIQRFVAAYGPSSREEFSHWWGILERDALRIFQSITDELEEIEFEGHKAWLRREDLETVTTSKQTKSVRLVPSFDPYIMFYHPRELLVEGKHRTKVFRQLAGWVSPVLLIDGVVAGIWQYKKSSNRIQVIVEPLRPLDSRERQLLQEETTRLGEFFWTKSELSLVA